MFKKSICAAVFCAAGFLAGADGLISFSTDSSFNPYRIPESFFGVGREYIYGINKANLKSVTSPDLIQAMKDLKVKNVRGPAGTIANYYLWKKGYMFTADEPDYKNYYAKEHEKGKGKGVRPITLAEVYEETIALDVPSVFAVNVVSQSPVEIAEMVTEIRKLTKRPIFLEMGNELFEPEETSTFTTCREYVAKVREINKAVKAVDPEVKVGVVCPSYPFPEKTMIKSAIRSLVNTNNKPIDRYLEWDDILAANSDAFDAVILHPYIFFKPENATPESLMAFMFAWNAAGQESLKDYAKIFPGKKIWMTEYNVLTWSVFREKDPELKKKFQLMKNQGCAVANMDTIMSFIDSGIVELSDVHTFADGQGFGLVQRWGSGYVKLPNYYTFQAVGTLIDENPFYYRMKAEKASSSRMLLAFGHVSQGPELYMADYENVGVWGFGDSKGIKKVLFINRTPFESSLSLKDSKMRRIWSYGGRDAIPEFLSWKRDWTAPPDNIPLPDLRKGEFADSVKINAYSALIVELQSN